MSLKDRLNAQKNASLVRGKTFGRIGIPFNGVPVKEDRKTGRVYITPEGKIYPSATTILGAVGDKSWLDEWRDRIGEKEANKITGQSARRGTELHKILEKYLQNDESYTDIVSPLYRDFFLQVKPIVDARISYVVNIEAPLYSDKLKIAGTVDLVAYVDGVVSIVDWKNARRFKTKEDIEGYFIQTWMYAKMFQERTGWPVKQLCIIMAVEGNTGNEGLIFKEATADWDKRGKSVIDEYYRLANSKN
jgi:hypothetical protein